MASRFTGDRQDSLGSSAPHALLPLLVLPLLARSLALERSFSDEDEVSFLGDAARTWHEYEACAKEDEGGREGRTTGDVRFVSRNSSFSLHLPLKLFNLCIED